LILRNDEYLVPGGQTIIEAGDLLLILADTTTLAELKAFIGRKKETAS
jgi:Trk K+ transport system NAD-binding subunit